MGCNFFFISVNCVAIDKYTTIYQKTNNYRNLSKKMWLPYFERFHMLKSAEFVVVSSCIIELYMIYKKLWGLQRDRHRSYIAKLFCMENCTFVIVALSPLSDLKLRRELMLQLHQRQLEKKNQMISLDI